MQHHSFIKIIIIFIFFLLIGPLTANSQNRFTAIQEKLTSITTSSPGLLNQIDVSVNGASLEEFLRGIAKNNDLNITVDDNLDVTLITNFSAVKVLDVLMYLCENYSLDIALTGNIITIKKYHIPPAETKAYLPKKPDVKFSSTDSLLSFDLKGDSLLYVAKTITDLSGVNIVFPPEIRGRSMNGYLSLVKLPVAMDKLASLNNLDFFITEDGFYSFSPRVLQSATDKQTSGKPTRTGEQKEAEGMSLIKTGLETIDVTAINTPISDIITNAAKELDRNYFFLCEIKEKATLNIKSATFDELLHNLLLGTNYTYRYETNSYIIGERTSEGLRNCKVIQFQHRPVKEIIKFIPESLKQNVTIAEFPELNSLIVCGSEINTTELEFFLRDLDKTVPQVLIEVIIIDKQTNHQVKTGIKAGISDAPTKTQGQVFPELDINLGSDIINSLIGSFNSFGIINIGKVTPNFYLSLSAMENNGLINIRSTPKLATLNGNEAKMTIGNTEYYLEEANNVIGSQNPQNIITKTYKAVQAEFSLTIKPIIQGDDQITLDVQVEQSDFTGRTSAEAPPGKVTRTFNSIVRIRNEEMILLGGLEEKSLSDAGDGVPLLSRIPIIKWLFSSKTKERSKKKLNIFIKPTIVY